jgi:hypothetical protein
MKTLADIKRRMTPGTQLEVVEQTKRPVLVGTVRAVVSASASNLTFTSDHTADEEYIQAWPKARDVQIIDADTFEYELRPGPGTIRLRFLPQPCGLDECDCHTV